MIRSQAGRADGARTTARGQAGPNGNRERQLVRKAVEGDRTAYAEIVREQSPRVFRIAARFAGKPEAVNDLAEAVFVRAWERLDQWDEVADFRIWLYQVAVETCLEHAASPGEQRIAAVDYTIDDLAPASRERSKSDVALNRNEIVTVYRELEKLPPIMRAVIIVRALEDASYRELSAILRQPVSTIDTWIRHGLTAVKDPLAKL